MTNRNMILIGVGVIGFYFLFMKEDEKKADKGGKKPSGSGS